MVQVIENYRGWQPPFDAKRVVETLLGRLPESYRAGLGAVVLTCAGRLSRRRRRGMTRTRRRKVRIVECLGLYHRAWRGERAWIELFVDNIAASRDPRAYRLPPWREVAMGSVLFHELGHHLHATQAPEHREKEAVAERWQQELLRRHVMPRVWRWLPVLACAALVLRLRQTAGILRGAVGRRSDPSL